MLRWQSVGCRVPAWLSCSASALFLGSGGDRHGSERARSLEERLGKHEESSDLSRTHPHCRAHSFPSPLRWPSSQPFQREGNQFERSASPPPSQRGGSRPSSPSARSLAGGSDGGRGSSAAASQLAAECAPIFSSDSAQVSNRVARLHSSVSCIPRLIFPPLQPAKSPPALPPTLLAACTS